MTILEVEVLFVRHKLFQKFAIVSPALTGMYVLECPKTYEKNEKWKYRNGQPRESFFCSFCY